eukprot:359108-Chlamydomonas_euryale.AAC.19
MLREGRRDLKGTCAGLGVSRSWQGAGMWEKGGEGWAAAQGAQLRSTPVSGLPTACLLLASKVAGPNPTRTGDWHGVYCCAAVNG